jgi:hypothetical protein
MKRHLPMLVVVVFVCLLLSVDSRAQHIQTIAPRRDAGGGSIAIVLKDSAETVTLEYHTNNGWVPLALDAGKDGNVLGDRVRVATTRQDKAVMTVDLPAEPGKKYRLAWNKSASMWDIREVQ